MEECLQYVGEHALRPSRRPDARVSSQQSNDGDAPAYSTPADAAVASQQHVDMLNELRSASRKMTAEVDYRTLRAIVN